MEAYSVVAYNTATASTNKIHDDDVARQLGFRGGLVPGVDVYAYLCHPPAARWGREWLQHGTMRARFHVPVYDGHEAHISSPDGERLELHDEEGGLCADGAAALGGPVSPPDADDWPDVPQTISPPPASPEVLVPGTAFGLEPHGFHAAKHVEYLADVREELPIYRGAGHRPPGVDPPRRQLRAVVQRPPRSVDPRRVRRPALRPGRGRTAGRLPRHRHGGVGAQGPPLRADGRPPHRRRGSPWPGPTTPPSTAPEAPDPDVCGATRRACDAFARTDVGLSPGRGWRRSLGRTRCG